MRERERDGAYSMDSPGGMTTQSRGCADLAPAVGVFCCCRPHFFHTICESEYERMSEDECMNERVRE